MKPRTDIHAGRFAAALTLILLGLPLASRPLIAQQAWAPGSGYGSQYGSPYAAQPYASPQPQYAQPQGYPQQPYPDADQQYPPSDGGQPQPGSLQALNPDQLEQLVAPIALYPDALLAQVLAASTYPAQVAAADAWLQGMRAQGYGSPDQVAAGADAQTGWDPSIKSLTAFPQVLDMMARNLQWTTSLGNAYYNQPQDVMQTVQVLRQRAEDAGSLQSTPQEPLTYDQGYIELAPPSPQVVYVPAYNPWTVYGQPIAPYPGFSLAGALGSFFSSGIGGNAIQYGLGIALSAFGHTPWGFLGWGLNWLAQAVLFHQSDYFTHSTTVADWGLPHGGPRAYYARQVSARLPDRYFGGVHHVPDNGRGLNPGHNFVQPAREFYGSRGNEQFNPRYQQRPNGYSNSYVRPAFQPQQAYNRPEPGFQRAQPYASRQEPYRSSPDLYGRSAYGNAYANRPAQNYGSLDRSYRAPAQNYARNNDFSQRAYSYNSDSFAKEQRSSGFHLFGHGRRSDNFGNERASNSFYGGERMPKSFGREREPKMPKMPKMHRERAPKYHSGGGGHHSSGRRR